MRKRRKSVCNRPVYVDYGYMYGDFSREQCFYAVLEVSYYIHSSRNTWILSSYANPPHARWLAKDLAPQYKYMESRIGRLRVKDQRRQRSNTVRKALKYSSCSSTASLLLPSVFNSNRQILDFIHLYWVAKSFANQWAWVGVTTQYSCFLLHRSYMYTRAVTNSTLLSYHLSS